ncbi:MAG: hypothetical protein QW416_06095 [Candidatus Nitrosocaldaceae archaeon]
MLYVYILIPIAIVAIIVLVLVNNTNGTLEVDAFKDQADVVGFYRVMLKNNANHDISNIIVDFGNHNVTIPKLHPNESIIISPKDTIISNYVTIKADPDIFIQKEFRTAPRMPGMIGGMG